MSKELYCPHETCRIRTYVSVTWEREIEGCPVCFTQGVPVVEEVTLDDQLKLLKRKHEVLEHRFEIAEMEITHLNKMLQIENAHSKAIQQQIDRAIEINEDLLADYKAALNV